MSLLEGVEDGVYRKMFKIKVVFVPSRVSSNQKTPWHP